MLTYVVVTEWTAVFVILQNFFVANLILKIEQKLGSCAAKLFDFVRKLIAFNFLVVKFFLVVIWGINMIKNDLPLSGG